MYPDSICAKRWRSDSLVPTALFWAAVVLAFPKLASPASIFPSAAPDYYQCQAYLPPFAPTHIYVLASGYPLLSTDPPLVRQGITSAEFRIDGLSSNQFIINIQPGSGGLVEGDFFGVGGRISFPECRPWGTTSCLVLLLDIMVFPIAQVMDGTIMIRPLASPCNEAMESTLLGLCDAPVTTQLCTPTAAICFNATNYCPYCPLSRPAGTCTLPIAATTWSRVKALFH